MRRGFTLIEIVAVIAVTGILAVGTFRALSALFVRGAKARAVTELSLSTQTTLDQLSLLLYSRVGASVIGYDPADGTFARLEDLAAPKPVLEWLGTAEEAYVRRDYSGFVDMNASDPAANVLVSPDTDGGALDATEKLKFGTTAESYADDRLRLVFAGTFDSGAGETGGFGWHGGDASAAIPVSVDAEGNITLGSDPAFIYEKYYLVDTAYAVARGADVNLTARCIGDLGVEASENTLYLFYDYRPWKGESFCADPAGGGAGRVTILAEEVQGFRAETVNGTIRLGLDTLRPITGSTPVHVTKQKVVF
jgi:prepilin-type N-terminal cleavage/methylation domain-containing protein